MQNSQREDEFIVLKELKKKTIWLECGRLKVEVIWDAMGATRGQPRLTAREMPAGSNKDPAQPKIN